MFELLCVSIALYAFYLIVLKEDSNAKDKIITAALFVPLAIVAATKILYDKIKEKNEKRN